MANTNSAPARADGIKWGSSLETARREAGASGKLVLIDLFNPG
jgi:hypothetical protein